MSVATASRVLSGAAGVSRAARAEVRAAAAKLSYVPLRARAASAGEGANPARRSAADGLIAAVVCADVAAMFSDSFFSRLLLGVTGVLPAGEAQLALLAVSGPGDFVAAERFLARSRPDGVLLIGARAGDPMTSFVRALEVPTVLAGRPLSEGFQSYVDVDNRAGARAAVTSLVESFRHEIATIAGPQDLVAGVDRLAGYRDAVGEAGLREVCVTGDFTRPSGERAMARLLRTRPNLDAVFAASDLMAVGALSALRRAGRRVPDDVAVIGFDDAPFAAHTSPSLTTVRQPVEEMGAAMARQVLSRVADDSGSTAPLILGTALIHRDSD